MIIYSKESVTTAYRVELPEITRDWWLPKTDVLTAATIATSTTSAAIFRQVVKYDVTSIQKNYSVILDNARAQTLLNMLSDTAQSSFYVHNGTALYECAIVAEIRPASAIKNIVTLTLHVLTEVS
jgi:hypothetical protein